jgi:NTP pyrophosphatase (non-canonical NTP hydrolase)
VGATFDEIQREAVLFRDAREWAQFHKPKDLALGLGIEAGELGELFLWLTDGEIDRSLADPAFRQRLAEELGDVQLFLLYLAEATGIDLAQAARDKLRLNDEKYPVAKAKGSAKKYDQL